MNSVGSQEKMHSELSIFEIGEGILIEDKSNFLHSFKVQRWWRQKTLFEGEVKLDSLWTSQLLKALMTAKQA